jgi:hypothetical protein
MLEEDESISKQVECPEWLTLLHHITVGTPEELASAMKLSSSLNIRSSAREANHESRNTPSSRKSDAFLFLRNCSQFNCQHC